MSKNELLRELSIDRTVVLPPARKKSQLWILVPGMVGVLLLSSSFFLEAEKSGIETSSNSDAVLPRSPPPAMPDEGSGSGAVPTQGRITASAPGRNKVLDASGYVVAMRIATVSSKAIGRVEEVFIEEGMRVEKNQVLAKLNVSDADIQLELAKARLRGEEATLVQIQNRLTEATQLYERQMKLHRRQLVSDEERENSQLRVSVIEAELESQKAKIDVARHEILLQEDRIKDSEILSPFEGIVIQKSAQPGEIIAPSTSGGGFTRTGIATIVDMNSLQIEVDVSESYIGRVFVGQHAEAILQAYSDLTIPVQVSAIVPLANRQKGTIKVRLRIMQFDPRIIPDMSVKVSFYDDDSRGE